MSGTELKMATQRSEILIQHSKYDIERLQKHYFRRLLLYLLYFKHRQFEESYRENYGSGTCFSIDVTTHPNTYIQFSQPSIIFKINQLTQLNTNTNIYKVIRLKIICFLN